MMERDGPHMDCYYYLFIIIIIDVNDNYIVNKEGTEQL